MQDEWQKAEISSASSCCKMSLLKSAQCQRTVQCVNQKQSVFHKFVEFFPVAVMAVRYLF